VGIYAIEGIVYSFVWLLNSLVFKTKVLTELTLQIKMINF